MNSNSDQEAQPWGGLKADFSEAFRPTGNGGAGAEPPLTMILIKSNLTVRRPLLAGALPPHPPFSRPKGLRNVGL